ncbi:hypothetical protein T06_9155 [Trichinella sp. T6]|nr:hypothetical protein T06_9155 [Trichinella sp. T6]
MLDRARLITSSHSLGSVPRVLGSHLLRDMGNMPTRNTNGSGGTLTPVHPGSRCATGSDKQRGLRPGVRLAGTFFLCQPAQRFGTV